MRCFEKQTTQDLNQQQTRHTTLYNSKPMIPSLLPHPPPKHVLARLATQLTPLGNRQKTIDHSIKKGRKPRKNLPPSTTSSGNPRILIDFGWRKKARLNPSEESHCSTYPKRKVCSQGVDAGDRGGCLGDREGVLGLLVPQGAPRVGGPGRRGWGWLAD